MFPIRCFTCGAVIGSKYEKYKKLLETGLSKKNALDRLNVMRICCRRMFLTHVELIDKLLLFPQTIPRDFEKNLNIRTNYQKI